MRELVLILTILAVFSSASRVRDLTSADFGTFIHTNEVVLIEFYAPWCPVCTELEPLYENVAGQTNISLARVDCVVNVVLCQQYATPIYPMFRVFRGQANVIYDGPRTEVHFLALLERHNRPLLPRLMIADIAELRSQSNITIVAHVPQEHDAILQLLVALEFEFRNNYSILWASTTGDTIDGTTIGDHPMIVLYKDFDEKINTYSNPFTKDAIREFVLNSITPLIREIGTDFEASFIGPLDIPVAYVLVDGTKQRDRLRHELLSLAADTREEFLWVIVDTNIHPKFATQLGFEMSGEWPAFAISERTSGSVFREPRRGSIELLTTSHIRAFIDEFRAGTLPGKITDGDISAPPMVNGLVAMPMEVHQEL